MEFNEDFLQEMGLAGMPADQKVRFLAYAQEELEVRIGERISEGVDEEKLAEFDRLTEQADAARWLEENRPDFRDVVHQAIDEMKAEILANRAQLLGQEGESAAEQDVAAEPEVISEPDVALEPGVAPEQDVAAEQTASPQNPAEPVPRPEPVLGEVVPLADQKPSDSSN